MRVVSRRLIAVASLTLLNFGCTSVSWSPRIGFEEFLVYHPQPFTSEQLRAETPFEDADIETRDRVRIHGWFQEAERPTAIVLYCHGNAGNIASRKWMVGLFRDDLNCSVLIFDYRGYGRSEGTPSESGILEDARAARQWLAKRTGATESEIVLVGTSLGGAVAVDLAAKDGARALILGSTFTSLPDVASSYLLGLPTSWLMHNRFDSEAKIKTYSGPLLQMHGEADGVAPFKLGRRLFDAANEPKQFIAIPGAGHNDPPNRELVDSLRRFLEGLPKG